LGHITLGSKQLFSKGEEGFLAAHQLADLVEHKLAKGEPWIDDALKLVQRFDITREDLDAYGQLIAKGEKYRRAARLADLVERRLDGEPWTEDNQELLQRFKISREEVDAEVTRRGGTVS